MQGWGRIDVNESSFERIFFNVLKFQKVPRSRLRFTLLKRRNPVARICVFRELECSHRRLKGVVLQKMEGKTDANALRFFYYKASVFMFNLLILLKNMLKNAIL